MTVLRRPGGILRRNGMFGTASADPSHGFRGTAFGSYSTPLPMQAPEPTPELAAPIPLPASAPAEMPGVPPVAPMMPLGVRFNKANDAAGQSAYLEAIQSGKSIPDAMRAQSIAKANGVANGFSGNAYLGRQLAEDANARANSLTGANVRQADANTNLMIPSLSAEATSRAKLNTSRAAELAAMTPVNVEQGKAALDRYRSLTIPAVRSAELGVDDAAQRIDAYRTMNRDLLQRLKAPTPQPPLPKPPSPRDVTALGRMLLEQGRDDDAKRLVDAYLPTMVPTTQPATSGLAHYAIPSGPQPSYDVRAPMMPFTASSEMSTTRPVMPVPTAAGRPLSAAMAQQIFQEAGGDKQRAIQIALQRGFNPYK